MSDEKYLYTAVVPIERLEEFKEWLNKRNIEYGVKCPPYSVDVQCYMSKCERAAAREWLGNISSKRGGEDYDL